MNSLGSYCTAVVRGGMCTSLCSNDSLNSVPWNPYEPNIVSLMAINTHSGDPFRFTDCV